MAASVTQRKAERQQQQQQQQQQPPSARRKGVHSSGNLASEGAEVYTNPH